MTGNEHILIIDDDIIYCEATSDFLRTQGFSIGIAHSGKEGLNLLSSNDYDLILLDQNLPDTLGIQIIEKIKIKKPDAIVIMVTAEPQFEDSVEAIKIGASNYLVKPCSNNEILFKIKKELQLFDSKKRIDDLENQISQKFSFSNMIGYDSSLKDIFDTVHHLAQSTPTILITGETGTGKGLLAKAIHQYSSRKHGPFVTVNAGTLSEEVLESELFGHVKGAFTGAVTNKTGWLEKAHEGTIFIDEIGDMPLKMQINLLRFIQDKEFEPVGSTETKKSDARIITATHRDLELEIQEGNFREDLFYRINVVSLRLPSLRERRQDLPALCEYFIKNICEKNSMPKKTVSSEVQNIFYDYDWPGNVRQLENCLERMVLLEKNNMLTKESMPPLLLKNKAHIQNQSGMIGDDWKHHNLPEIMGIWTEKIEREYLENMLAECKGNISLISARAGLNRKSIYQRLIKYNLDKANFKGYT